MARPDRPLQGADHRQATTLLARGLPGLLAQGLARAEDLALPARPDLLGPADLEMEHVAGRREDHEAPQVAQPPGMLGQGPDHLHQHGRLPHPDHLGHQARHRGLGTGGVAGREHQVREVASTAHDVPLVARPGGDRQGLLEHRSRAVVVAALGRQPRVVVQHRRPDALVARQLRVTAGQLELLGRGRLVAFACATGPACLRPPPSSRGPTSGPPSRPTPAAPVGWPGPRRRSSHTPQMPMPSRILAIRRCPRPRPPPPRGRTTAGPRRPGPGWPRTTREPRRCAPRPAPLRVDRPRLALAQRPREGGADVVVLEGQLVADVDGPGSAQLGCELLHERGVVVACRRCTSSISPAAASAPRRSHGSSAGGGCAARRRDLPSSGPRRGRPAPRPHPGVGALARHGLDRIQVGGARESTQPAEEHLELGVEQVVAPGRRCRATTVAASGRSTSALVASRTESSRASSAAGESSLLRAAASSIASGRPSRRRQIVATASALRWSSSNPWRTGAARSQKSRTAADCRTSSCPPTPGPRAGRRRTRAPRRRGGDGARWPGSAARGPRASSAATASAPPELLEVVEHQQRARCASWSSTCSAVRSSVRLSRSAMVAHMPSAVVTAASGTKYTPSGWASASWLRDLDREPGLAGAAGPAQRDESDVGLRQHRRQPGPLVLTPDEGRPWLREAAGRPEAPDRREHLVVAAPLTWKRCSGVARSFNRCSPRSDTGPLREAASDQGRCRVGQHHLATVGDRGDPGGAVHVHADVPVLVRRRFAGVQAHPDPDPLPAGQALVPGHAGPPARRPPRRGPSGRRRRSCRPRCPSRDRPRPARRRAAPAAGWRAHRGSPAPAAAGAASSPRCRRRASSRCPTAGPPWAHPRPAVLRPPTVCVRLLAAFLQTSCGLLRILTP